MIPRFFSGFWALYVNFLETSIFKSSHVGRFEQRWYHRASETHRTLVSLVRVWNPKRVNTAGDAARELQGSTQAIHNIIRTEP